MPAPRRRAAAAGAATIAAVAARRRRGGGGGGGVAPRAGGEARAPRCARYAAGGTGRAARGERSCGTSARTARRARARGSAPTASSSARGGSARGAARRAAGPRRGRARSRRVGRSERDTRSDATAASAPTRSAPRHRPPAPGAALAEEHARLFVDDKRRARAGAVAERVIRGSMAARRCRCTRRRRISFSTRSTAAPRRAAERGELAHARVPDAGLEQIDNLFHRAPERRAAAAARARDATCDGRRFGRRGSDRPGSRASRGKAPHRAPPRDGRASSIFPPRPRRRSPPSWR